MRRRWVLIALSAAITLAGCDTGDTGGLSADEARQLDEAAAQLDETDDAAPAPAEPAPR